MADGAKQSLFSHAGVPMEGTAYEDLRLEAMAGDVGVWLRDQVVGRFKARCLVAFRAWRGRRKASR